MIYIDTHSDDVAWNLALEYYFAAVRPLPETIFLFWPTEPTVVIGRFQNAMEEINLPYLKEHEIRLVRRMSGGGTIYADRGNRMYSFIEHQESVRIEFHRYLEPVICALAELGVEASFNGRNDLVIGGRKFSGNSQYRLKDRLVHHGTMMFDVDIEAMAAVTAAGSDTILSKSVKSVRSRVTNIAEHLPRPVDMDAFGEVMVRHIMGGPGYPVYELTPEDTAAITKIADERFRGWENVYGRSPKFNIDRSARLDGGRMQFRLEVQKGIITQAALYGDFFASVDADTICAALIGCRYDRAAVLEALQAHGVGDAVYRVTAREMAAVIAD